MLCSSDTLDDPRPQRLRWRRGICEGEVACRQLNKDCTCFYYGLPQGTTGWARCQAALAEQGQSELRILAQMQAQAEMQDFGNRLGQTGRGLRGINPSIPAAPSIPQTLDCSDLRSPGDPCR
jgi:hypothetical protein